MTLLAAYHTAYNVVGVSVLLPATRWFAGVVERLLPSRQTPLERALDPSALANPMIAIETARRVVADVLAKTAGSVSAELSRGAGPTAPAESAATLAAVRDFLSELTEPPETEAEQLRLTSTLHALDHASRLVESLAASEGATPPAGAHGQRAATVCADAMRAAQAIGRSITTESALSAQATPIGWTTSPEIALALAEAEGASRELHSLQQDHRAAALAAVAPGELTAAAAFGRIEAVRRLDRIAHHAWRSAAHLFGHGTPEQPAA